MKHFFKLCEKNTPKNVRPVAPRWSTGTGPKKSAKSTKKQQKQRKIVEQKTVEKQKETETKIKTYKFV